MEFIVRLAEPRDDAAVGDLLVDSFVETYAKKMPHVVVTDERKKDLRDLDFKRRHAAVFVAEHDALVVGTVTIFPAGAPSSEAWRPRAADLRQLAIHSNYHGRGLSRKLLEATERQARAWNCPDICLHVRQGAFGVARLYGSRGYLRDPEGDIDHRPEIYLEAYYLPLAGGPK